MNPATIFQDVYSYLTGKAAEQVAKQDLNLVIKDAKQKTEDLIKKAKRKALFDALKPWMYALAIGLVLLIVRKKK